MGKPRAEEAFWNALLNLNDYDHEWCHYDFPEDHGGLLWGKVVNFPGTPSSEIDWDDWTDLQGVRILRQAPATGYRVDFFFCSDIERNGRASPFKTVDRAGVIVEIDEEYHDVSRKQRIRDRQRSRNLIRSTGFPTLHFSEEEVYANATACALEVFAVLEGIIRLKYRLLRSPPVIECTTEASAEREGEPV